jgi:hypothetical protein
MTQIFILEHCTAAPLGALTWQGDLIDYVTSIAANPGLHEELGIAPSATIDDAVIMISNALIYKGEYKIASFNGCWFSIHPCQGH